MLYRGCLPIIIYSNYDPELTLTYFMPRSDLVIEAFIYEKMKLIYFYFSKTVAAHKVCKCIELNDLINLLEYQIKIIL